MHSKKNVTGDDRFSKVFRDPKFKTLPKRKGKVKIDKRFQSMFTNDAFQVKYAVDKRGRRISQSTKEDLSKFYHLSSSDENDSEVESTLPDDDEERDEDMDSSSDQEDDENSKSKDSEDDQKTDSKKHRDNVPLLSREEEDLLRKKQISKKIRKKLKDMNVDYARGEGKLFSDSSSDESESEESESEVYHEWNELDKNAEITDKPTKRLAICNMDWDNVKALDLMALFKSFLPAQGAIYSVVIYPSEFGLQRLAEEEMKGPAELLNTQKNSSSEGDNDSDDDDEGEEGKQYRMELMREYQLNRLKYYYAVATFDSAETANVIYDACNGFEYQKSGILLDLRFIDDDMTFDQEPKDVCNSDVNLQKYKPLDFTNSALLQTKVELTWDETDPRRRELTQRLTEAAKKGDINDSDLEDLVALSGSDEEDEEDDLLEALQMNCTSEEFAPFQHLLEKKKSSEKNKMVHKSTDVDLNDDEEKVDSDDQSQSTSNAISKRSKKHKKTNSDDEIDEKQKGELELLLMENESGKCHFNIDQLQETDGKKRKKRKFEKKKDKPLEDNFQVDVNDERFSSLYTSHKFNIDPTDPNYRKTKGMQAFVEEKQRRICSSENNTLLQNDSSTSNKERNSELSSLVKKVKNKTKFLMEKYKKNKINKES